MHRKAMLRAAAVAATVAAAACSREGAIGNGDIAARVNGGEIPVARVEAALGNPRAAAAADPSQARSRALEAAIDQELLVQRALAARLERDPDVARALDESRRRILARAWLDRAIGDRGRAAPAQVRAFYRENPALFGARRIYSLRELRVSLDRGHDAQALRAAAARGGAARFEAWLAREHLRFEARETSEPAESLPLALLARLSAMKDGAVAVIDGQGGTTVVELLHSLPAPLGESEAAPLIERFLASRRRVVLAREEVARLRARAHIDYVGAKRAPPLPRPAGNAARPGAVDASIETTYDQPTQPGIAASAVPGKDQTS